MSHQELAIINVLLELSLQGISMRKVEKVVVQTAGIELVRIMSVEEMELAIATVARSYIL